LISFNFPFASVWLVSGSCPSHSCLAHIVNLATQALLSKYSSTPHINTDSTTDNVDQALTDLTNAFNICHDEIGLVQMLTVKARSSAKRTQLLKDIQSQAGAKIPLNLILDMKVCWSSTFAMLQRAYDLRDVSLFPAFVSRMLTVPFP
jgi:hypothetical protein